MKPGSILVDLAVEQGGNVEGVKLGQVFVTANGAKIPRMPLSVTCTAMYSASRSALAKS